MRRAMMILAGMTYMSKKFEKRVYNSALEKMDLRKVCMRTIPV